ncbi:MAG: hypothetical protein LBH65_04220 [Desulfovibrio sp.]|jgi:uncharacterized Fe-S radical SAM superfamily protein PflX|nr:hypothetical protein [Desulfovibrio sp.]
MMEFTLVFRCVFCQSTDFVVPHEGYKLEHGEMVTCASCGRENDYSSLYEVTKEEGIEAVKDAVHDMLKDIVKGSTV